jgi:hypothetical protein
MTQEEAAEFVRTHKNVSLITSDGCAYSHIPKDIEKHCEENKLTVVYPSDLITKKSKK